MSNQLQTNLDMILQEKNSKLLPENLRAGITLLGVTGTMQESGSGEVSQASNIIHDTSELYNYSPNEGDIRFYMSYDNTQLYNIFKYVDGAWQEHRLNNAIFGDDYENSVAGTNSILYDSTGSNSGDNSGGNSGIIYDTELPADYDGHLDEIGTFMANLGTTDGCAVSGLSMSTPSLTKTMEETMFATNYLNNWLPDAQGTGLNVLLYSSGKMMQIGVDKSFPYRRVNIMDNNNTVIDLYTETFMDSMVKDSWSTEYFDGDVATFTALTQEQLDTTDFSGLYDNIDTVQVYGDSGHITRNNIINALLTLEKIFNCTISSRPNEDIPDTEIAKKFEFSYPDNSYVTGITFNEGVNAYNIQYNGAESTDFQFIYLMYLVGDSDSVTYEHHTSYSEGYGVSYENSLGTLMTNAHVTYMVQYEGLENQTYWYTYEFEGGRVIYKDVAGKPLKDISYFENLSDAIWVGQVV